MRSQFMPLALCLFLTVFVTHGSINAMGDTFKKEYNYLVFNELKQEKDQSRVSSTQIQLEAAPTLTELSNLSPTDKAPHADHLTLSVNSYKNNGTLKGSITQATENFAMAEMPSLEKASFMQGMFYGFFVVLVLLNLVCFFLFGEKLFISFFTASAAAMVLFSISDGTMIALGFIPTAVTPFLTTIALVLVAGIYALFSSNYLRLEQSFPKLKLITYALLAIATSVLIGGAIMVDSRLLVIANIAAVSIVSLYFIMGVVLFSRKNYAKFYMIASSIPTLFLIDFFVLNDLGIGFLSTQPIHLKTAILVQTLIITYAIVYRMRALKEENELRQTEMRIFMKRQELMNRKNVERMVQEVYLENLIMQYDLDGLEIKLLQYISEGKPNAKIARKLKVSEKEVEEYTNDLYAKLEIREHIQEDHRMLEAQPDYIYN